MVLLNDPGIFLKIPSLVSGDGIFIYKIDYLNSPNEVRM